MYLMNVYFDGNISFIFYIWRVDEKTNAKRKRWFFMELLRLFAIIGHCIALLTLLAFILICL